MPRRFEGKVAFVTGAASGIGHAMAVLLLGEGAKVAVVDLPGTKLEEVYAGMPDVLCLDCDVSDYDRVQEVVAETISHFGSIDVLMNNAGRQSKSVDDAYSMLKCPKDVWLGVIDVNVNGAFYVGQAVARQMVKQGGGAIVNTCSLAAYNTFVNAGGYGPSKAALTKMTEIWAKELTPLGVRVNGIAPGTAKTGFTKMIWSNEEMYQSYLATMPMKRFGKPEEMAAAALFLASEDAGFIAGEVILVDGGQHL